MGRVAALEWLRSRRTTWLRALLFLLLWLTLLDFPRHKRIDLIDTHIMLCLGHFLVNGFQAGVDYVLTYGPLGYFVDHVYDADLFWCKYAWEIVFKFSMVWLLLRWAGLLRSLWMRTAYGALLLLFWAGAGDALYLFCLVLLGLLPLRDEGCRTPGRLAAGTVLLAVLSLTKFTFLYLGIVVWVIVLLAPSLGWRTRIALAAGFPLAWASAWVLIGQSLGNIPSFLTASWEIVRGYSGAVGWPGDSRTVYAALAALALFFILSASYSFTQLRRRENLLGLALLSAALFLVWKNGFVRQDDLHMNRFFSDLLLVPFAVEGLLGQMAPPSRLRAALATTLVGIGILGLGTIPKPTGWLNRLCFNGVVVLTPAQYKRLLDREQKSLAEQYALPNIRRLVGEAPADLISSIQGFLFLNQLNYQPRPVFHSYSTYTPDLAERNAAFYRSEQAPAFVLCHFAPIDYHFPSMEDGPMLLELFHRYRFVTREHGFLLFQRLADSGLTKPIPRPVLLQRNIAFEEEIQLDQLQPIPKTLSVRIEESLIGRLRTTLFRPPLIALILHTHDGETYSYRLIPGMASSEFLLDPLIRQQADIEAFCTGQPLLRVRSFSIHIDPDARMFFQEPIEITVRGDEGIGQ